jgi:hypothetical protein
MTYGTSKLIYAKLHLSSLLHCFLNTVSSTTNFSQFTMVVIRPWVLVNFYGLLAYVGIVLAVTPFSW